MLLDGLDVGDIPRNGRATLWVRMHLVWLGRCSIGVLLETQRDCPGRDLNQIFDQSLVNMDKKGDQKMVPCGRVSQEALYWDRRLGQYLNRLHETAG